MIIDKEKLETEKEMWKNFYKNYDSLADCIFADVLAYYEPDKRIDKLKEISEIIKGLDKPISGDEFYNSVKGDLESFIKVSDEAAVAYRTLSWLGEIEVQDEICADEPQRKKK